MPCDDCSRSESCPPCVNDAPEPEAIHKWKRCDQCRHPEHPSACEVCRCLAVTSAAEIAERCRSAGGCPKHPRPKPAEAESVIIPVWDGVTPCTCAGRLHHWHSEPKLKEAGCAVLHQDAQGNAIPRPDEAPAEREEPLCDCHQPPVPMSKHVDPAPLRPPYAIAYSVEGQLYELWLPGDATVVAMDGVLIIEHHGRAVSGITQVLPVRQEK